MSIRYCTIPVHQMECVERYHKQFLEHVETRTLDQTVSVLLKYSIGDTKKISPNEIVMMEDFFDHSEYIFNELLQSALLTLQTKE